jgi:hypothetical protein
VLVRVYGPEFTDVQAAEASRVHRQGAQAVLEVALDLSGDAVRGPVQGVLDPLPELLRIGDDGGVIEVDRYAC